MFDLVLIGGTLASLLFLLVILVGLVIQHPLLLLSTYLLLGVLTHANYRRLKARRAAKQKS